MKFKFICLNRTAICIDEIKYLSWQENKTYREKGDPVAAINVYFKDGKSMHIPYHSIDEYDSARDDALQKMGLVDENYDWIVG